MAIEKEKKFLPSDVPMDLTGWDYEEIQQGYLMVEKQKQLRVRLVEVYATQWNETVGWLTYKQDIAEGERHEFEVQVKPKVAEDMMALCETKLTKRRWSKLFRTNNNEAWIISVDEYTNGLKVIEVEQVGETKTWPEMSYTGKEVTTDPNYSNITLAKKLNGALFSEQVSA